MKFHLFATTTVAALALAACGTAEETTTETAATEQTAGDPAAQPGDPSTPQGFVDAAAASDMYELEAARVAQEKTQNQAVRDFAQMMIDDHTTSSQNLRQAAGEVQGVNVAPQMTPQHQQHLTELRNASAEEFDALYREQQVAAHEQTLQLMQTFAQSGTAQPLQTFATNTAPIIERHLSMARELPES